VCLLGDSVEIDRSSRLEHLTSQFPGHGPRDVHLFTASQQFFEFDLAHNCLLTYRPFVSDLTLQSDQAQWLVRSS